jgi:hypothetical protein
MEFHLSMYVFGEKIIPLPSSVSQKWRSYQKRWAVLKILKREPNWNENGGKITLEPLNHQIYVKILEYILKNLES